MLRVSLLASLILVLPVRGQTVDYTRDIKPILSNHCYACHGPDDNKREGGLRLDDRTSALKSKAFVPGKASESEIIRRVLASDPEEHMPPASSKKPALSPAQVETLKRWIDQGAKYDQHWAYVAPVRVEPPTNIGQNWSRNGIDRFIAQGHQRLGFAPVAEADRRSLIRRLSFDLLGLPPSPAEVEAFIADPSPDAYEKLVDRLLASKHFGERMGMYWLDLVRYADTGGYHSDNHRDITPYRDYVINAFNSNKPFDRFTIEQLAGDLLPNPTAEQRIASGYNRLLQTTEEGGAQAKEYTAKYLADRVRNASSVWLASTMGCAECHNHKFDPFTTRDFYRFGAFFADVEEVAVGRQRQIAIPTPEQETRLQAIEAELLKWRGELTKDRADLAMGQAAWLLKVRGDLANRKIGWQNIKPMQLVSAGKQTLTVQDDLTILASGANPAKDTYTITLPTDMPTLTGIRLETLTHPSFPNKGLSRANGNFVLTDFTISIQRAGEAKPTPVKIAKAIADFEQPTFPVANAIDGNAESGWAVSGHETPKDHLAVFTFESPIQAGKGTVLTVRLAHNTNYAQHNIGHFRLALTSVDQPQLNDSGYPADVIAAIQAEKPTPAQSATLSQYYRNIAPELAPVREAISKLEAEKKTLQAAFPQTLVTVAMANPRMVRVLPRGNWLDDSGEVVSAGTPGFLFDPGIKDRRATRLDLAKWLVARENPLTARVFVNRMWKLMYGRGLVTSLEDFGSQGTLPSHPQLLDWLAIEFQDKGWDVKYLLKLMAMSATYRQSSVPGKDIREKDPFNVWLTHQNRYRLDAEMLRDNALAISGLLSPVVGGGSVKPYQPSGYWAYLNFPRRDWAADKGVNQYRRGLYTYWCRSFLHPSMAAFDAPSREECTVERPRSSTPLQALVLLNDPSHVEAARVFAENIIRQGGATIPEKLDWAFRRAVSRPIRPNEVTVLQALFDKHRQEFAADAIAAKQLLSVGEAPLPANMDLADLAAWTSVARVILNLHETITRN